MTEPQLVPIADVLADRDAWPRTDLDSDRVALFIDLYADSDLNALPPLEVVPLPDGALLLTDGWHRLNALRALRTTKVPVRATDTGGLDPWLFAYQRGLETCVTASRPLTRSERRAATERLLTERPELTDVAIARLAGVSNATVGRARRRLLENSSDGSDPADPGDQYAHAAHHAEVNRILVRQLTKLWDARPLLMAAGLRDTAALGDSLGQALVDKHGPEEALVWAQRLGTWAQRAAVVAEYAQDDETEQPA